MNSLSLPIGLLALLLTVDVMQAQRVDFEAFPQLDANYTHLDLEIEITGAGQILGRAEYEVRLMRDHIETLRLDAVRMDMEEVAWNGEEVEYRMNDDRLVVILPEDAEEGVNHALRIRYRANPAFGVYENNRGTIWSSAKPGAVRHWVPAKDHPRNSFTADFTVLSPVEKEVVFPGVPGDQSVESVDLIRTRFRSETEQPASALTFAIGDFDLVQTTVGRHRIYLYSEEGLLDEQEKDELLDDVHTAFRHAERTLGRGYHSRDLYLVVLEDNMWESKNYGAGLVFGFKNVGELSSQLTFGVTGQWLGVALREEQWEDAEALMLLQAWLHKSSEELPLRTVQWEEPARIYYEGVYKTFSVEKRAAWNAYMKSEESQLYRYALDRVAGDLLEDLPAVINWYDFTSYLYNRSGLNLMESPAPVADAPEEPEPIPEYRVIFDHDEQENRLHLEFRAVGQAVDELVTLVVEEYTFGDMRSREITFTGQNDEVVLNVNPGIEYLKLTVRDEVNVELKPEKPFNFWINQFRSDENSASRAEAAAGLAAFADNPDLQLALLDMIEAEENPKVYAEAIRTLATVTGGASGTDQLFRQRFSLDREIEVQKAIIEAFANYPDNDQVIGQLRNTILNSSSRDVKEQAVVSLAAVSEPERFRSLSESLLTNEEAGPVAPLILRELARAGETEAAVLMASEFLESRYPDGDRIQVLDLLLDYDRSAERWQRRILQFISDYDPRMRYRILDGLQFLTVSDRDAILGERVYEEYDERVLQRLDELAM